MLPQVLAGLGLFSLISAGCLFWLDRLKPVFFTVAMGSLVYQVWAVRRRPPVLRTWGVKTILVVSLVVNTLVIIAWIVLWFRYHLVVSVLGRSGSGRLECPEAATACR